VALNFRQNPPSELGVYAHSFHRAGRILARSLARRAGYHDTDACPIVMAYRQALELYLKGLIASGRRLLEAEGGSLPIKEELLGQHRLSPLVPALQSVFKAAGWQWHTDVPNCRSAAEFRAYLRDLEAVDPLSFSFRYPTDKSGKSTLAHHFGFNVLSFAETLDPIFGLFDGAMTGLEDAWDTYCDARAQGY
jgi:hypothetical protein